MKLFDFSHERFNIGSRLFLCTLKLAELHDGYLKENPWMVGPAHFLLGFIQNFNQAVQLLRINLFSQCLEFFIKHDAFERLIQ
ncbi:Uncharacterised protein [Mycobacteroides abscessus subsp. abscessus]|nr:Uncharacterised protein [Mycobacteroides abscessus subsp. abscessus]